MIMKIQYENAVILQPCLFNNMASADVRSPCGKFAKRQGIIHFVFAEPKKLTFPGLTKMGVSKPLYGIVFGTCIYHPNQFLTIVSCIQYTNSVEQRTSHHRHVTANFTHAISTSGRDIWTF
ncbi:MAG: hypothetical protein DRH90_20260 [Deltaproteobacteria bacterium]|nr:MAG: hypothetical protein DRH90_20260 [Deltaproteobacteria bacterium]RLC14835.1 MAG: hypothetical protein DRI24_12485 [Deltaproteobacteria bacterium]